MTGPMVEKRKSAVVCSRSCLMGVEGLRLLLGSTSCLWRYPVSCFSHLSPRHVAVVWGQVPLFPAAWQSRQRKVSACLLFWKPVLKQPPWWWPQDWASDLENSHYSQPSPSACVLGCGSSNELIPYAFCPEIPQHSLSTKATQFSKPNLNLFFF